MKCSVKFCNNYGDKNSKRSFFRFPSDARLSKIWADFCHRNKEFKTKNACICMDHFNTNCIENEIQFNMGYARYRILKHGSIPTIFSAQAASEQQETHDTVVLREVNSNPSSHPCDEDDDENNSIMAFSISDAQAQNSGDELLETLINIPIEPNIPTYNLQKQIEFLSRKIILLRRMQAKFLKEIRNLKETSAQSTRKFETDLKRMEKRFRKVENAKENMDCNLKSIFTKAQVNKIQNAAKKPKWTAEDIAQSITLYATSAKAYNLLYKKGFPIPSVRTLHERTKRIDISSGLIQPVFQVLSASTQMTTIQRLCVLSFGEMKIQNSYSYCKSSDSTLAPANYVQVAMLRGLMSKWIQPVFYDFDCKMTGDLLKCILRNTTSCGYTVVAIVCDLRESNTALCNELEVNEDKPWFLFDNEKVFVFADVPYLIKLQRNYFIDRGFIINGKHVKTDILFELLNCTPNSLSITHKISASDLRVNGAKRQTTKMAAKLFSNSIAQAIKRAANLGHLNVKNCDECHQLFKVTNDWFDVMNARVPRVDKRSRCNAYGLHLDSQNRILDKMIEMIKNMRVIGRRDLLPFQKGIIQSIYALKLMFPALKCRFGIKYLLTYHLNHDLVINFFEVMRAKGGLDDQPDRQTFNHRFRAYILGSTSKTITAHDTMENILADDMLTDTTSKPSLTGSIFNKLGICIEDVEDMEDKELESLQSDSLENVAEYVCHKLQQENDTASTQWSDHTYSHLSESSLTKPSVEMMMGYMTGLNTIFNEINGDGLLITKNFTKIHMDRAQHVQCKKKLKRIFFRTRMYLKIKKLNKEMPENIF